LHEALDSPRPEKKQQQQPDDVVFFTTTVTRANSINQSINQIYLRQISGMKHREQSEYVDRTQRLYETALTRALKNNTTT